MAQERSAQHVGSTANASIRASHQGGASSTGEATRSMGSVWGATSVGGAAGHTLMGAGQSMFGSALSLSPGGAHGGAHGTTGTTGATSGGGAITDRHAPMITGGKQSANLRVTIPQVNPSSPMPRSPGPPTKQQMADWREALPPEVRVGHSSVTEGVRVIGNGHWQAVSCSSHMRMDQVMHQGWLSG
jgi:hypothetical protein